MGVVTEQDVTGSPSSTSGEESYKLALRLVENLNAQDVDALKEAAESWQPALANGATFREEMQNRIAYLQGSMGADMVSLLLDRFPQSYTKIKKFSTNVKLYKRIVESKARAFYGQGNRAYLVDDEGVEIEAEESSSQWFQWMLKAGRFWTAAKMADKYVQACTRALVKPWWEPRSQCVQFAVWPQHLVYFVPCSDRYWSADDCYAVLLEMPGRNSISADEARYEIWAKVKVGEEWKTALVRSGYETVSVKVDEKEKTEKKYYNETINAENKIPFANVETGEPQYPFVWWCADTWMSLYFAGDEDALTVPRQVNTGLTDLNFSMHYNSNPMTYWEPTNDNVTSKPPAVARVGPGEMVEGGDWRPASLKTGFSGTEVLDVWNKLIDMGVEMDIGTSAGVLQEKGGSESGLSVQVKRQPLQEHRQDMIEIYRPLVEDTLTRAIMVWNLYCDDGLKQGEPSRKIVGNPCWEPGDIVDVQDKEAEGRSWAVKIENNTATPIDQLMNETGMDEKQAIARIEKNAKLNRMLRAMSDPNGEMPDISLPDAIAELTGEQTGEEKTDKVETEKPVEDGELVLEKTNIYQIAKAIEMGAATTVDMRMALFHEDRAEAEKRVKEAMAYNQKVAPEVGQALADKAAPLVEVGGKAPSSQEGVRSQE
jgi:hypothetical protein